MKRFLTLALFATAFASGIARADYNPYWDAHREGVQSLQFDAQLKQTPLDVQTDYNP